MRETRTIDRLNPFFDEESLHRYLFRICLLYLPVSEAAEDAVMEAKIKAWVKRDTFRSPAESATEAEWRTAFKKWIAQIARNHCLDILRRRSDASLDDPALLSATSDPIRTVTDNIPLYQCLQRLKAADLEAFDALVFQEMDQFKQEEVAALMTLPLRTVQTAVARAKRKLRKCLEGETAAR